MNSTGSLLQRVLTKCTNGVDDPICKLDAFVHYTGRLPKANAGGIEAEIAKLNPIDKVKQSLYLGVMDALSCERYKDMYFKLLEVVKLDQCKCSELYDGFIKIHGRSPDPESIYKVEAWLGKWANKNMD